MDDDDASCGIAQRIISLVTVTLHVVLEPRISVRMFHSKSLHGSYSEPDRDDRVNRWQLRVHTEAPVQVIPSL